MPSVWLSIWNDGGLDCDHRVEIVEKSCTVNCPTPFLFVTQRPSTYSQGSMGKFWGDWRWWEKKWCAGAQVAKSLKCVKTEKKILWSIMEGLWELTMAFGVFWDGFSPQVPLTTSPVYTTELKKWHMTISTRYWGYNCRICTLCKF